MKKFITALFVLFMLLIGCSQNTNPLIPNDSTNLNSYNFSQGKLELTGVMTDFAIDGPGLFILKDKSEHLFYRRPGSFYIHKNGYLVLDNDTNVHLQGIPLITIDSQSNIVSHLSYDTGSISIGALSDVCFNIKSGEIKYYLKEKPTDTVTYDGNLSRDSEGLSTILHSNRFLTNGKESDILTMLFDEHGNDIGARAFDSWTMSCKDGNNPSKELKCSYSFSATTTIRHLADTLKNFLNANISGSNNQIDVFLDVENGSALIVDLSSTNVTSINNLILRSDRPTSAVYVANLFSWGPYISSNTGDNGLNRTMGHIRTPAASTDDLADVYDASGNSLGLESDNNLGDEIIISGKIGNTSIELFTLTYNNGINGTATTMDDLLHAIQNAFILPDTVHNSINKKSVHINPWINGDNRIPIGSIVICGEPRLKSSLTNVIVNASNSNNNFIAPTGFVANMYMTEIQSARDSGFHSTTIIIHDEYGDPHTMTTSFIHTGIKDEWEFKLSLDNSFEIIGGNKGRITFDMDGMLSSLTFNDNFSNFTYKTANSNTINTIFLDVGTPGDSTGISQFRSITTAAAKKQNGHTKETLINVSFDDYGTIKGIFTSQDTIPLFQIPLANFLNLKQLIKTGNYFKETYTSGEPVVTILKSISISKLKSGYIETEP